VSATPPRAVSVASDAGDMSRRERQQEQVVSAFERGHLTRALVLAYEHLREFPDDVVLRDAAAKAERRVNGYRTDG